jgi:hypothetical protein
VLFLIIETRKILPNKFVEGGFQGNIFQAGLYLSDKSQKNDKIWGQGLISDYRLPEKRKGSQLKY